MGGSWDSYDPVARLLESWPDGFESGSYLVWSWDTPMDMVDIIVGFTNWTVETTISFLDYWFWDFQDALSALQTQGYYP